MLPERQTLQDPHAEKQMCAVEKALRIKRAPDPQRAIHDSGGHVSDPPLLLVSIPRLMDLKDSATCNRAVVFGLCYAVPPDKRPLLQAAAHHSLRLFFDTALALLQDQAVSLQPSSTKVVMPSNPAEYLLLAYICKNWTCVMDYVFKNPQTADFH